jgi:hypothetical protein
MIKIHIIINKLQIFSNKFKNQIICLKTGKMILKKKIKGKNLV